MRHRPTPKPSYRFALTGLIAAACTLALTAAPAYAVGRYSFSTDIGAPGSAAGQLTNPGDVAVNDSTGDLYVADTGNHRVDQFDSAGHFIRAWGWGVENGEEELQTCTETPPGCQAGLAVSLSHPHPGAGQLSSPDFIEVDNSTGPSAGDLYVAEDVPAQPGVDDVQQLTLTGATGGAFSLIFNGGGSTTTHNIGNTVAGSTTLKVDTSIKNNSLTFFEGESISAPGIPPDTTVVGTEFENGEIFISTPATETHSDVTFTGNLPYDAEAATLQRALNGSFHVEGPAGGPYTLTASSPGPRTQFEAGTTELTPNSAQAEVTTTQVGIPSVPPFSRVQKFDPEGRLITTWEEAGAKEYSAGIAGIALTSAGSLVVEPGNGEGIEIDDFGNRYSGRVAVDRATGDLYLDTGTEIDQFLASNGCPVLQSCPPSEAFGAGDLTAAAGIALDPSTEVLYAANAGAGDLAVFTPLPLPILTTEPATVLSPTSVILNGTVDPTAAGEVTKCRFEYIGDASFRKKHSYTGAKTVPCSPEKSSTKTAVTATLTKLNPFTTYHYRISATTTTDQGFTTLGRDLTVTPAPVLAPAIDATSSASATPTTVTLQAQIDPELSPTIYRFRYGTSSAYGSATFPSESIGEDAVDHPVSSEITGLTPGTTYHFRAIAINLNGITEGPDQTFDSPAPPAVAETSASAIGPTTATLGALLKPGFRPTTFRFEYGTGTAYGHATPQSVPLASDDSSHPATAALTGLAPSTTYHFRVVATNEIGTTPGPDQTFTTAPEPEKKETSPPPKCHKGQVLRHGKCVKKPKPKKHHKRGGKKK